MSGKSKEATKQPNNKLSNFQTFKLSNMDFKFNILPSRYFKLLAPRRVLTLEECYEELNEHQKQLDFLLKGQAFFQKTGVSMCEETLQEIKDEQEEVDYYKQEIIELEELNAYNKAGEVFHKVYSKYH